MKNIYENGELSEESTCANFAQVADNEKTYQYKFYSLSAIIAVGYRVIQDRLYQSDFGRLVASTEEKND